MGHRHAVVVGMFLAGGGGLVAGAATYQDVLVVRYRPAVGAVLPRVTETETEIIFVNLPSLPDSTPVEISTRTMVTQRVLRSTGDTTRVDVTYDSVRVRARVAGGAREPVALPSVQRRSSRFLLDDRLRVLGFGLDAGSTVDTSFSRALFGYDGGFHVLLPETAIASGGTWTSETRFAIGPALGASVGFTAVDPLDGSLTLLLDSLVPRGADTLAYITTEGTIGPDTVAVRGETGQGTASFRGRLAGRLVWSTSWHGFVAGVLSGSMVGSLTVPRLENPIDATLVVSVSSWHQVRP